MIREKIYSGLFKIDSYLTQTFKMKTDSVKVVNTGTNTDPFNVEDYDDVNDRKSQSRLKVREDIRHIHITNSDTLHDSYNFGELLGQGTFGTVVAVNDKNDDKQWAMKIIPKTLVGQKMQAIKREIQILKMVKHPHIIFLHRIFESNSRIYLILEKCTGELGKLFKNSKPFSEADTRIIITQLAGVVDYLHKNDIVHRDLKLENILLAENPENSDDNLYIKVTDFGLGIIKEAFHEMLHDRVGTLVYLSPEVITKGSYSHQCDIWSMGVIMYLLLHGKYPFYGTVEQDLMNSICNDEPDYSNLNISDAALHLVNKMLTKDPAQRMTAAEVKMHAWIEGSPLDENKNKNVLEMMKMWRSDMMLPQGTDCDWVSTKLDKSLESTITSDKEKQSVASVKNGKRQSMKIPIHNIQFDRTRRGNEKHHDVNQKDILSSSTVTSRTSQRPQWQHYRRDERKTNPSLPPYKKSTRTSNGHKS